MNISMTNCLRCGSNNINRAQFCSGCGAPLENMRAQPIPPSTNNNRAMIALVLGIAGLFFCGFTAIPGAIMSWMEMQAVREGRVPANNGGMAKIALGVNVVALVLTVFGVVLLGLFGIAMS